MPPVDQGGPAKTRADLTDELLTWGNEAGTKSYEMRYSAIDINGFGIRQGNPSRATDVRP